MYHESVHDSAGPAGQSKPDGVVGGLAYGGGVTGGNSIRWMDVVSKEARRADSRQISDFRWDRESSRGMMTIESRINGESRFAGIERFVWVQLQIRVCQMANPGLGLCPGAHCTAGCLMARLR